MQEMAKTWHVSFDLTVTDNWIDDGFDFTHELLTEVIQSGILDYAYEAEKKVERVVITEATRPETPPARPSIDFPSGDYYVGDMCYVLPNHSPIWDEICDALEVSSCTGYGIAVARYKDAPLWIAYTSYGEGYYRDQQGKTYAVDSG